MAVAQQTRQPVQMTTAAGGLNALLNIPPASSGLHYVNIDNGKAGKAANSGNFGPSKADTYTLSADNITYAMGAG